MDRTNNRVDKGPYDSRSPCLSDILVNENKNEKKSQCEIKLHPILQHNLLARCHPLSERYELAITAFAAWRVDIFYTWSVGSCRNTKIELLRSKIKVVCMPPVFRWFMSQTYKYLSRCRTSYSRCIISCNHR